jgi:hypothetical protein
MIFASKLRHLWREWDRRVMIKMLKEKLNALEEVQKRFVARNDIPHRLG